MTTTDTPRTYAARFEALRGAALRQDCIPLKLGEELERELNASKAEVESYKKLAIELVQELISKCDDQIHKEQLIELTK